VDGFYAYLDPKRESKGDKPGVLVMDGAPHAKLGFYHTREEAEVAVPAVGDFLGNGNLDLAVANSRGGSPICDVDMCGDFGGMEEEGRRAGGRGLSQRN
jgi:hypothetical protein